MTRQFAVTWDYRCPFARIVHDHVITGLRAGADWDVRFAAFSLDQTHVEEGLPKAWEEPERYPGLLANLAGIVVRDRHPEQFLDVHHALFEARHQHAVDLRARDMVAKVLSDAGVDAAAVLDEVDSGWPLQTIASEHTEAVDRYDVFGVPTFIVGDRAIFVRLMARPGGDGDKAIATVDRVLDLIGGFPELNEFKYTTISN